MERSNIDAATAASPAPSNTSDEFSVLSGAHDQDHAISSSDYDERHNIPALDEMLFGVQDLAHAHRAPTEQAFQRYKLENESLRKALDQARAESQSLREELDQQREPLDLAMERVRSKYDHEMEMIYASFDDTTNMNPEGQRRLRDCAYGGVDIEDMEDALRKVREEFQIQNMSRVTQSHLAGEGAKIRQRVASLRVENAFLKEKCRFLNLHRGLNDSKTLDHKDQETMLADLKAHQTMHKRNQDIINSMMKCNGQLEEREVDRHPLFEVGVAVRKRFLEEARAKFPQHRIDHPGQACIDEGNAAVYHANGSADAALLITGQMSLEWGTGIFQEIYSRSPEQYQSLASAGREVVDNQATIGLITDGVGMEQTRAEAEALVSSLLNNPYMQADDTKDQRYQLSLLVKQLVENRAR